MNFDQAFDLLIGNEGGYSNNSKDPGGETNWGISKRSYPDLDIANLTRDQAKAIYLRDFWVQSGAEQLPAVGFDLFDMAVNSGAARAVRTLQDAVGTPMDGVLGPRTIAAASALDPTILRIRFNACRLIFMTHLPNWPDSGKGWARRIAADLKLIGA